MSYGYAPQYVTEEQEMSESDCHSDGQMQHVTTDVTELYRRNHQARNSTGTYYHTHMPGYYEQPSRVPPTCACNLQLDPRYYYYKTTSPNQEGPFRSSTHLAPNMRTCHDTKNASAAVKKYPVTARTPRYFRCAPVPLCKRPSTLCLPLTCQPDPAVFHRPRKVTAEVQHYRGQEGAYAINDYVMRTTAVKRTDARPVDSEGDVNSRLNDLENLLTKFDNDDEDEAENETVELTGVNDISKILKPKIPASVKAKQDKKSKLRAVKPRRLESELNLQNASKLEVKEADEPLEALLHRLNNESNSKRDDEENHGDSNENKEKPQIKMEFGARRKHPYYTDQKPSLDDNSALELHKSKSYIVSLIDKALSKELGTIPGDKCTRKEFLSMSPKRAIEMVNRHAASKNFTRTVSLDIATPSNPTKKEVNFENRSEEEPLYLKQLKQLRWSHLRHIQREAKRLADLERFLDSFGEIDSAL